MAVDHDIIIAGGGLNGPTLALALAQAGLSVAVVDARPARARASEGFDGRAYALALASRRLIRSKNGRVALRWRARGAVGAVARYEVKVGRRAFAVRSASAARVILPM